MLEQELQKRTLEQSSSTSINQGDISNKETLELLTKEIANNAQLYLRIFYYFLQVQVQDAQLKAQREVDLRKAADDKAHQLQLQLQTLQASQSVKSEQELLTLANEQLRKKERTLRELEKKQEIFEGKNQENKTKNDLLIAQNQLGESIKKINMLLDKKLQ